MSLADSVGSIRIPGRLTSIAYESSGGLMKSGLATFALLALCTATLGADVRVTSTTTIEGAVASMMGGLVPSMVTHIRGSKSRTDIVVGNQKISTIVDVDAKQVIVLNATDMTAKVLSADSV